MAAAAHVASEGVHRGASIHNQLVAYQVSPPCRNDLWTNSRSRGSQPSLVAFQPAASRCRNQNEATCCRHTAARTQLERAQHRAVASEGLQPHLLCQRHAEVLPTHTLALSRSIEVSRLIVAGTAAQSSRVSARLLPLLLPERVASSSSELRQLKRAVSQKRAAFEGNAQHDAHELM